MPAAPAASTLSEEPGAGARPSFARRLGLFDATMIVISGIVGSGIFINPYVVAQAVGTPFLIVGVWVGGGAIALLGAFVFAELSTVMPRVGGQYAFFREAFHPMVAFLHGWSLLLIVQSGATAAVAVAFAEYMSQLAGLPRSLVPWLAAAVMLLLAGFHALGVRPGAVVINVITFGKVLVLAALILGVFLVSPHSSGLAIRPLAPPGVHGIFLLSAFFAGLVPAMFSYGGWQNVNFVAEEVRDPQRNLPRAILLGVACVIVLYVGANLAYLHVLTAPVLAASRTPAADAARQVFGSLGGRLIGALVVVSTFGFLNLALLTAPRVYYAMAADGLFFRRLARLSPRFRVPVAAILLQGGLAAAFALSRSYERLLAYAVFADWIFFALAGAALLVFRRKLPGAPRPFPTPGYPWVPILFTLAGVGIVFNLFFTETRDALLGTTIIAAGVPVYLMWRAANQNSARVLGWSIWAPWLVIVALLATLVATVSSALSTHGAIYFVGWLVALSLLLALGHYLVAVARSPSRGPISRNWLSTIGWLLVCASFILLLIFAVLVGLAAALAEVTGGG